MAKNVQIQGKRFDLPMSQGRLKMSNPVPVSKDFIYTLVASASSQLSNSILPDGLLNIPFYVMGVSCACVFTLTASPTIFRTTDVSFEFAFNAGDVAGRQQSRWFNDVLSGTTENHVRGICGSPIEFPTPIYIAPSSNFFCRLDSNGVDPGVATATVETSIQVYGRYI